MEQHSSRRPTNRSTCSRKTGARPWDRAIHRHDDAFVSSQSTRDALATRRSPRIQPGRASRLGRLAVAENEPARGSPGGWRARGSGSAAPALRLRFGSLCARTRKRTRSKLLRRHVRLALARRGSAARKPRRRSGRMKILAVLTAPAPVRTSQREAAISVIVFAAIESPEIAPFAIATSAATAGAAPLTD